MAEEDGHADKSPPTSSGKDDSASHTSLATVAAAVVNFDEQSSGAPHTLSEPSRQNEPANPVGIGLSRGSMVIG